MLRIKLAAFFFILPAVVVILGFSIFPLVASLYVSLSRLRFSAGGTSSLTANTWIPVERLVLPRINYSTVI